MPGAQAVARSYLTRQDKDQIRKIQIANLLRRQQFSQIDLQDSLARSMTQRYLERLVSQALQLKDFNRLGGVFLKDKDYFECCIQLILDKKAYHFLVQFLNYWLKKELIQAQLASLNGMSVSDEQASPQEEPPQRAESPIQKAASSHCGSSLSEQSEVSMSGRTTAAAYSNSRVASCSRPPDTDAPTRPNEHSDTIELEQQLELVDLCLKIIFERQALPLLPRILAILPATPINEKRRVLITANILPSEAVRGLEPQISTPPRNAVLHLSHPVTRRSVVSTDGAPNLPEQAGEISRLTVAERPVSRVSSHASSQGGIPVESSVASTEGATTLPEEPRDICHLTIAEQLDQVLQLCRTSGDLSTLSPRPDLQALAIEALKPSHDLWSFVVYLFKKNLLTNEEKIAVYENWRVNYERKDREIPEKNNARDYVTQILNHYAQKAGWTSLPMTSSVNSAPVSPSSSLPQEVESHLLGTPDVTPRSLANGEVGRACSSASSSPKRSSSVRSSIGWWKRVGSAVCSVAGSVQQLLGEGRGSDLPSLSSTLSLGGNEYNMGFPTPRRSDSSSHLNSGSSSASCRSETSSMLRGTTQAVRAARLGCGWGTTFGGHEFNQSTLDSDHGVLQRSIDTLADLIDENADNVM